MTISDNILRQLDTITQSNQIPLLSSSMDSIIVYHQIWFQSIPMDYNFKEYY